VTDWLARHGARHARQARHGARHARQARHGAWKKLFLMTHILQYRAARARQDSLADNPKN
jgi:hypothetical protein